MTTGDRPSSAQAATEVVGLILAAGQSRRMGSPKLTLPWRGGVTVIETVVSALRDGGVPRVVVVVGEARAAIEQALARQAVEIVENRLAAEREMIGSIQTGLQALGSEVRAAVLTPGDLPELQPGTVRMVIAAWLTSPSRPCLPVFAGRRGHPVVLPRSHWAGVLGLGKGESLRSYLRLHRAEIQEVVVSDAGIRADIDTPEEYRAGR